MAGNLDEKAVKEVRVMGDVAANWMRNHFTISFLGLWEQIHNPNFKPIEFDRFKSESGR